MRRRGCIGLSAAALLAASPAAPRPAGVEEDALPRVEVHGVVDVRFAAASAVTSWLDGGIGRTRWGGAQREPGLHAETESAAFRAAQLSLVIEPRASELVDGHLHLNLDADEVRGGKVARVGVVEAFVRASPVLAPSLRLRVRAGVVIPPFSLEHPDVAWSTRYTITPSAIGTWLGEELKATGLEGTLVASLPGFRELELQGGAFTGNDTAGTLLAWRGFALHDRQGQIADELPLPPVLSLTDPRFFAGQGLTTRPFREIDGRPGWWAQGRLRFGDRGALQGGWYDNRGDTAATDPNDYTWNTRFAVGGGELRLGPVLLIGQLLDGRTRMGVHAPALVDAPFRAGFVMASFERGAFRLTGRYDRFRVEDEDPWGAGKDLNEDDGRAVTVAWLQRLGDHHRIQAEIVDADVEHPFAVTFGEPAARRQRQFQAGWRLVF